MAKFKKGGTKPPNSGRKKGSKPNPKSLRNSLADKNFDLTTELLLLYKTAENENTRFQILKMIASYTQPPAPTEDTSDDDSPPEDPEATAQLIRLLKDDK